MHFNPAAIVACATLAAAIPHNPLSAQSQNLKALSQREAEIFDEAEPLLIEEREEDIWERDDEAVYTELEKRRGGGGGRGSSGSSSSSGGSRSGSGSTGGSSGGSSGSTSASKGFGGGQTYAGGGGTTFKPGGGARSPNGVGSSAGRSLAPAGLVLGGAGLVGLGLVATAGYGYYHYPYGVGYGYNYRNRTANKNSSLPVECYCAEYNPCGCGPTDNATVTEMLKNSSVANIRDVNGTQTVVINGTLPNGTDTEDTSAASSLHQGFKNNGGFLAVGGIVAAMVFL